MLQRCCFFKEIVLLCAIIMLYHFPYYLAIEIALVNDENKLHYGRVEIVRDGKRSTICDYDWSTYDAQVTCRQLGFPGGQALKKSYFGAGNDLVALSGMTCDNSELSILSCPNKGWNIYPSTCLDHQRDAGVKCTRNSNNLLSLFFFLK